MPPDQRTSPALPIALKANLNRNPIGIGPTAPRLSWRLQDSRPGAAQAAYQIQAASNPSFAKKSLLWDTETVAREACLDIAYQGPKLKSRQRVYWRVRLTDHFGLRTEWSETALFETGLLSPTDWQADWIGRTDNGAEASVPCPHFRKQFSVEKTKKHRARLYISARGLFHILINGKEITVDRFGPGWTEYNKKIPYITYDITKFLRNGPNTIGVILGDGWYRGNLFHPPARANYGTQLSLLCQLELQVDGQPLAIIPSDKSWLASTGPIVSSDIYDGEAYDARLEMPGWATCDFDSSKWKPAEPFAPPPALLAPRIGPLARAQETLKAIAVTSRQQGVHTFDFGQNLTGVARIKLRGKRGQTIQLRFGEMLNEDDSLYTENLRFAKATDLYTFRGDGLETFQPLFSFHGFRYLEITGLKAAPAKNAVVAVALHSEMEETGSFSCSEPLLNQLQSNIRWGQKGNFLELPTDCPQRDERLGWTGDAQIFIPTAAYNFDVSTFFAQWLDTLNDGQSKEGAFPDISPDVFSIKSKQSYAIETPNTWMGNAGWGDAGVICPWELYQAYGDKAILESGYPHMVRWIDYQEKACHGLVRPATVYGDWLAVEALRPEWSPTPSELIGTAYFARTTQIMAQVARLLGNTEDAARFDTLLENIKQAFRDEFVTPNGLVAGDTQTSYLLALAFDLVEGSDATRAIDRLVTLIKRRDNHLSTGFLGTPLLCPTLSRYGKTDLAYRILLQQTYPSWLYPVVNGATTMWERWNSWTKETGFGDTGMNSFNHYAYGAIGQWLYRVAAGLDQQDDSVAYKRLRIRPQIGSDLQWAKASLKTPYGLARSEWKRKGSQLQMEVEIPPNTTAEVYVPARDNQAVKFLSEPTWDRIHAKPYTYKDQTGIFTLPAGLFRFESTL